MSQFQPHQDMLNSLEICERNDRLIIISASSDCSVALWDVYGNKIGVFGQVSPLIIDKMCKDKLQIKHYIIIGTYYMYTFQSRQYHYIVMLNLNCNNVLSDIEQKYNKLIQRQILFSNTELFS